MSTLGRNIAFPIYKGNGSSFHNLVIRKSTSDSVVMSLGDKVTGDVYYKDNTLVCDMDEYIVVDGVKYSIVNPPTIVREGLKSDNGDLKGMTKYSFEFYHPMYMLGNMAFSDVAVTNAESMFKSHDRTFSWIGNLTDFVAKLNKNLQDSQFIVSISSSIDADSRNVLSDVLNFTNNTIADALKTAYDTWHFPFVVDVIKSGEQYYSQGKRFLIQFGNPTREILDANNQPFVFHFGKGVGLKNNSRTPRNNKIVTRVAGYGSEQNIPYGYPQIPWTGDPSATTTADGYPIYEGIVGGVVTKLVKHPFTRTHLMPSVYSESVRKKVNSAASDYDNTTPLVDYYDAPSSYPNPINLDAPRLDIVGIETIKPELGDMAILGATPVNDDLTPASGWDDTMDDDGNYLQSYFKITLPQLDFDIYACASITEEMKINMRSGACIGCTFDAQVDWDDYKKNFFDAQGNFLPNGEQRDLSKYPKSNNGSIDLIVKKDLNTYGMLMPNVYQQPAQGDKFVILGISMPSTYITNAEERLDAALMTHMLDNNVYYYDYPLKFDEDFFYNNTDILSQVRPNSVLRFTFGGEEKSLYIKQITIKYGEGVLPKYDITLTDNIEVVLNQIGLVADDVSRLALAMMQMNKRTNINISNTESLQKYVDYTIMPNLESIQRQIDGSQVTYFGNEDPFDSAHPYSDGKYIVDPTKFPASEWDDDYSEHDGDMFYNRETGKGYEFTIIDNSASPVVYGWQLIQDEDIIQALDNAQTAQDTADGKRRVFICDASHHTPNPPYDVGDLWVNVKYPYATGATYDDEILKCVVAKTEGQSFSINDWSLANGYTAALRNFINGTYADDLEDIQNQIDGKAETWYQNTDPSTAWTTTALKNQHKGDIWHNSSTSTINGVKAGQDAIWNGTAWVVDETVPQAVYDEIDGKCAIYVSWGAWGNDLQEKDLFIPAADTTQGGITYKANKVYRCVDKDTPLFQEIAYTDDTQYNGFITKLIGSSGQTKDAAENAIAAIKHALNEGNTYNEGGLILSNLISLGTGNPTSGTFTPWAGISGIYKTSETGTGYKGHGIAAWFGGGMVDGEVSQSATNAAKSLFRFDGSGYVAGGNLSWDKNGNVIIQGYSINATTLKVGGYNVATESSISTFFANFFDIYNGSTQITYEQYVALQDKSNVSIKAKYGLWTEQFLSALGLNSQGGGGGTGDVSGIRVSSTSVLTPTDGVIDMTNYVVSTTDKSNWNAAYSARHTHDNKSVLDGITSAKVTSWDAVAAIMGEDPDEIINKWNEIIAFLLNIPEQTTLEQLLAAKANSTVQIIAGNGLTGGGNLQENRTLNVASANAAITVNADNIQLNVINDYTTTTNNTIIPLAAARGKDLNDRLAVLESWFEIDSNGDIKTKDKPNGTHRGFYSESFVSALGSNSSGGGAGGGTVTGIKLVSGNAIQPDTDGIVTLPSATSSVYGVVKLGTSSTTAATGNHTHALSIAADSGTNQLSLTANTKYKLTAGGSTFIFTTPSDTTYESKAAASGGTDVSLVTTGEKYTWNNKQSAISDLSTIRSNATNGNTAYGWGNHASAGYALTSDVYSSSESRTKNYVLAAPSTANGAATFRKLVASDIPDLSSTYATDARADALEGYFNTGGVAKVAAKLNTGTTTYSAWGVNYWENGVPKSVSGNMTSVGNITPSANGNNLGTSSARFNIYGTNGNFSSNVSITGTLGVTGATTLSSTLSVASGITLTTTKKIYFGDTSHYLELNSTGFHFSHGVYSDGFVSALGANSSGGGGGGVDLTAVWASLTNTENPTYSTTLKINVNHIPDISSTYGYAKTSQLGSYLPLSGGTMTGTLRVNNITASNSAGLLSYHPSDWTAVSSTQWGVGAADSQGVIRSSAFDLIHYKGGTNYTILDSSNHGNYAYALYGGTNLVATSSSPIDLNDLTTVGSYYCLTDARATYVSNKPIGVDLAFRVWVSSTIGDSNNYLRQRFQARSQVAVFERVAGVSSGGVQPSDWGNWYMVQDNISNYAKTAALSNYLPLSGGIMTGLINFDSTDAKIGITTTGRDNIDVGWDWDNRAGAGLALRKVGASSKPANFILWARNASNSYTLEGNPQNGILSWGGGVTALGYNIKFDVDTSREKGFSWLNTSETKVASVTYHNTAQNIIINPIGSANTYSDAVGKYSLFVGNNKLTYNTYTILHSNNYSSYALPLSGGTMTGSLNLASGAGITAETTSQGMLVHCPPSGWTGISSTQWGLGSGDAQGVIRSNANDLIHWKNGTNYTILDTSNYGNYAYALYGGTDIGATSSSTKDLNTYTTVGSYYLNLTANAQYVSNKPTTTDAAFRLWVTASTGTSDNYRRQRFQYYNSVAAYERFTKNNGSSWSSWYAVQTDLSQYLLLSGGTMTGKLNMLANQYNYTTDSTSYGLNMNNSDMIGVNGIYTSDTADNWAEGINFKRTNGKWDSIRALDGTFYFGHDSGTENTMILSQGASADNGLKIVGSQYGMMFIIGGGNVNRGIWGITSNKWLLYFNASNTYLNFGNVIASGDVTASSDERKKDILGETIFSVKDISNARSIIYKWNDKRDKDVIHGGSVAQDWVGIADDFITKDDDGYMSLNYGALALCSAITIAKEVVKHEDEITRLKKEVVKLRERVAELEERRIA